MKSWLPWQYLLRRAARRRGFIDPLELLARLRRFAQPSEVHEPIELVRAGVVFHARGLINTKVFQFNLDWIWPYWVVRQFDPADASFLPRAFSFSHVNLTHRNWTAVGRPGMESFPVVDPRGLVTLPEDPWSLDWWFLPEGGAAPLYPSCSDTARQGIDFQRGPAVWTRCETGDVALETLARVEPDEPGDVLVLEARVRCGRAGRLWLAARPANPEGVHFIEEIACERDGWTINKRHRVRLDRAPSRLVVSTYARGDLPVEGNSEAHPGECVRCPAGMATIAAEFPVSAELGATVSARLVLNGAAPPAASPRRSWTEALAGIPSVDVPVAWWRVLHTAAVHTIVLHAPGDIFPGPWTYRRFWFRDACLIMHALHAANCMDQVRVALERFPGRQKSDGYFHSQEGEWDANGQVLWIAHRHECVTRDELPARLVAALERGAQWIVRRRRSHHVRREPGLLPPGFSAEHLGPVDQYYWDDLWGIAGLRAFGALCARRGGPAAGAGWRREAREFALDVRRSLARTPRGVARAGMPAAPHRRMDSGAIGSLVADYPLQLDDVVPSPRLRRTADWLWRHCRHDGAFFQDMIHSGLNAYLSLALAQTFLRWGDDRHEGLMDAVAGLATSTGQWPEAVHPRTGGGCMGDGQHTWAAAEWIMAVRALFLREEDGVLVLGPGLRRLWFAEATNLSYGPTATRWGPVRVEFARRRGGWSMRIEARWHDGRGPRLWLATPGFQAGWLPQARGWVALVPEGVEHPSGRAIHDRTRGFAMGHGASESDDAGLPGRRDSPGRTGP